MNKREVGTTGIMVSELGLGCASFWGNKRFNESEAIKIVHTAIDKGVTLFDTGHNYSSGNAELRLGKALKNICNKSDLVISSKAGTRMGNCGKVFKDFTPDWIRKSCIQSLKKIGIESLTLFHLHGPSISDLNDDLFEQLLKLKSEGLIRAIGVNTFNDIVLEKILNLKVFDFVMPDYNILCRNREPLIDKFHSKGIGVFAGAPLADSLYSNRIFKIKSVKDVWYLLRAFKNFRKQLIKGLSYRFVNDIPGITGAQVALSYVLSNHHICAAVFGTTDMIHLLENLDATNIKLSDEIVERIRSTK